VPSPCSCKRFFIIHYSLNKFAQTYTKQHMQMITITIILCIYRLMQFIKQIKSNNTVGLP
jgi:predicted signal transduction protein with EAL and GGDEF domain